MGGRRGLGLATQATLLVAVAVGVTALVVGAVALAGLQGLTEDTRVSRLESFSGLLRDYVLTRIEAGGVEIAALSSMTELRGEIDRREVGAALSRRLGGAERFFDSVVLVDGSGRRLAFASHGSVPTRLPAVASAAGTSGTYVSMAPEGGRSRLTVWSWVTLPAGEGRARRLVGRLRTDDIELLLREITEPRMGRTALLIRADGTAVPFGSTTVPAGSSFRFTASARDAGSGRVSGRVPGIGAVDGSYRTLEPYSDLRVAVVSSGAATMSMYRAALLPALGAMLLAAAAAAVVALLWVRRIVEPLRSFERAAHEVAGGGYVRPIPTDRDDEVGRLIAAYNRMGVRLNSLQDLARLLSSGSNLSEVLDSVLHVTSHILGSADAAVLLPDEAQTRLTLAGGHGLKDVEAAYGVGLDRASPIAEAFRMRSIVSFRDLQDEAGREIYDLFDADTRRYGAAVPLVIGEDVLGVIVVLAAGNRPLSAAQVETLRAFSAHAAIALHNSRLFEREHLSRTESDALREAAELVATRAHPSETLTGVADIARALLGMDELVVAVDDPHAVGLGVLDGAAEHRRIISLWRSLSGRPTPGARYAPVVVEDAGSDRRVRAMTGPDRRGIVLVPLSMGDRFGGVLALFPGPATAWPPAPRTLALASTTAQQISIALENASLLQQARARAANLETVFRISQAVSSSLQLSVVLNRVLDVVQKLFASDAVSLMSYDAVRKVITTSMARGVTDRRMLYLTASPGIDLPGEVFATGAPVCIADLAGHDGELTRIAAAQGLRSLLSVPLRARGRSIGVLTLFAKDTDAYTTEDMELLLTFAAQAALAIDTADLYEREHHVASVMQRAILPERLPDIEGLESQAFYRSAGPELEIGGDFYDLLALRDGRAMLAIGDVCGKGVTAATKTSMIKYLIRGLIAAGVGPAGALAEVNRFVFATGDPSDIVTVWLGIIDLEARTVTYANAGHPPALLRNAGGVRHLEATGPLLGALPDSAYGEPVVRLRAEDVLLAYTDGITEARRGDEFFGEARVHDAVSAAEDAQSAVEAVTDALADFAGLKLRDDVAVVAVRVLPRDRERSPNAVRAMTGEGRGQGMAAGEGGGTAMTKDPA